MRIVYDEEDVVRTFSMQPKALVGDVERDILLMPWGKRLRGLSHSLFLISANTTAAKRRALGLDRGRTLASYRIKPTVPPPSSPLLSLTRCSLAVWQRVLWFTALTSSPALGGRECVSDLL